MTKLEAKEAVYYWADGDRSYLLCRNRENPPETGEFGGQLWSLSGTQWQWVWIDLGLIGFKWPVRRLRYNVVPEGEEWKL